MSPVALKLVDSQLACIVVVRQTLDVPELAVAPQHEREDFFRGDRGEFSIKVKSAIRWLRKTAANNTYYTQLILSDGERPVWVENEKELFRRGARVAGRSGFGLQKSGRHGRQCGRVYEVSVKESGYRNGGGGGRLDMLGLGAGETRSRSSGTRGP